MSRRRKHEEHGNHEAWAIPYADLLTLLLAFFVVMYAISSVNEGKYRVLSDSLVAAFRGTPRTLEPVQVGEKQVGSGADIEVSIVQQQTLIGQPRSMLAPLPVDQQVRPKHALKDVAEKIERAMQPLIDEKLVIVRRNEFWIEVEIRTDILFPSGVAVFSAGAAPILEQLAAVLLPFPNPIRVEGHTDDRPIRTAAFPSNWELSAARAASVVHLLASRGIDPKRLAVAGFAEYRPARENDSAEGRNANRRVVIVILSDVAMRTLEERGIESLEAVRATSAGESSPPDVERAMAPPATAPLAAAAASGPNIGQSGSGGTAESTR